MSGFRVGWGVPAEAPVSSPLGKCPCGKEGDTQPPRSRGRAPGFSPQVGGEELEVVVRGQRVQLLLQLLLGEAGRKPPDHHLREVRTVGSASRPALPRVNAARVQARRERCPGVRQKRPPSERRRNPGTDPARPSESAARNTPRTVRARVENSTLTRPRWAPTAPHTAPARDAASQRASPDWKHHRLRAPLFLPTPGKAASGGAGNGPLLAAGRGAEVTRPGPARPEHATRGLTPSATPQTLSPSRLRSGPFLFSPGLPAPPTRLRNTTPLAPLPRLQHHANPWPRPTSLKTIPLLARFARTCPPVLASTHPVEDPPPLARFVCPAPSPTLLRTVFFSSRGLPVTPPQPKDEVGGTSGSRRGDSRRNCTSTADSFSLPLEPRAATAAPEPPTPSFSERISHPPRSSSCRPPQPKRRENWAVAPPPRRP